MVRNRALQDTGHWRLVALSLLLAVVVMAGGAVAVEAQASMELPVGYVEDLIHSAGPAGPVVATESGAVFMLYAAASGATHVARLDVDAGGLTDVLVVPPWSRAEWLVGGPGDSFFVIVDGALLQVASSGSTSTWSDGPLMGVPHAYGSDGRMIGVSPDETAVVELHPDGSATALLSGRSMIYDLVVAADGTIYFADFLAEELVALSPDGSTRVVTSIVADNTDLAFGPDDNLYLNNAREGMARVDVTTGVLTSMTAPGADCAVILSPAEMAFDADGRAVFFSWVEHLITWFDPDAGTGGRVLEPTWANSRAADIGPDGALYVGATGCGEASPGSILRVTSDGAASVRLAGLVGDITGLALTDSGGLFVALSTETSVGIYYAAPGSDVLQLVRDTDVWDVGSISAFPGSEEVLVYHPDYSGSNAVTLRRFSTDGLVEAYTVTLPEAVLEFTIDIAPDGTVYAQGSELDRYFTGPVQRWLLQLDLDAGTSTVIHQDDRAGCCPLGGFGVDPAGHLWWILNPDFVLYEVDPTGVTELFATNTPVDAKYANRNTAGDLLISSPEGVYRVWPATLAERIALVQERLDELVSYGELSAGRANALSVRLSDAAEATAQGKAELAERHVDGVLRMLSRFVSIGQLDQKPASYVQSAIAGLVVPYLLEVVSTNTHEVVS